jgi:hypothetical protein
MNFLPTTIGNMKDNIVTFEDFYCGRPRAGAALGFGNPFSHLPTSTTDFKVDTRDEAVSAHREGFDRQGDLESNLWMLKGRRLLCWCVPEACHCTYLAERADAFEPDIFIVAGTGSRTWAKSMNSHKEHLLGLMKTRLMPFAEEHGQNLWVMSGGAEGYDHALFVAAQALGIKTWLALPNPGYGEYYWGPRQSQTRRDRRARFYAMVEAADRVSYVRQDKMLWIDGLHVNLWRNQFMVNRADHFFYHDTTVSRGTMDCRRRIEKRGTPATPIGVA